MVTHGRLCAIVSGMKERQLWSVDNWGDSTKAHQVSILATSTCRIILLLKHACMQTKRYT